MKDNNETDSLWFGMCFGVFIGCVITTILFIYTTEVTYIHYLKRVPCLNGERDHNYKETRTIPRFLAKMRCTMCGDERPLPKETYEEYKKEYGEMK